MVSLAIDITFLKWNLLLHMFLKWPRDPSIVTSEQGVNMAKISKQTVLETRKLAGYISN
jgi:hypothetical protein